MAELSDLVVELKQVNANLTNPVQSASDKESAAEKARADAELKGIFTGILDTLKGGMGKAAAVPDAVKKASFSARKEIGPVILDDSTIPHEIIATFGSSTVMLKPAKIGTGIIAGGAVRAVVELAGIRDVVTKARGSTNPVNTVKATLRALQSLRNVNLTLEERRSFNNKDIK